MPLTTITKAELLTLANQISGRAETDPDGFLKNVLHDLERDSVLLEGTEEITLSDGDRTYPLSGLTNTYRKPFHLQPKNATLYFDELEEISYDEYKDRLVNNTGNSRPLVFAVFNEVIYLDPPPLAATYTKLDIWGKLEHGDSVSTLLYDARHRDMLANGMAWHIFKRYGLTDEQKARDARDLYESEKMKFIERKANSKHHAAQYRDI